MVMKPSSIVVQSAPPVFAVMGSERGGRSAPAGQLFVYLRASARASAKEE